MEDILWLDDVRISKDLYIFISIIHALKIGLILIMYNYADHDKNHLLWDIFLAIISNLKSFYQWRSDGIHYLDGCKICGVIILYLFTCFGF